MDMLRRKVIQLALKMVQKSQLIKKFVDLIKNKTDLMTRETVG